MFNSVSTYSKPLAPPPTQVVTVKKLSGYCQMSPGDPVASPHHGGPHIRSTGLHFPCAGGRTIPTACPLSHPLNTLGWIPPGNVTLNSSVNTRAQIFQLSGPTARRAIRSRWVCPHTLCAPKTFKSGTPTHSPSLALESKCEQQVPFEAVSSDLLWPFHFCGPGTPGSAPHLCNRGVLEWWGLRAGGQERTLLLFFLMFIFETETEFQQWRSRERGRHRIRNRLRVLSCQHRARRGARTHKPGDHDPS